MLLHNLQYPCRRLFQPVQLQFVWRLSHQRQPAFAREPLSGLQPGYWYSQQPISLEQVLAMVEELAGYSMEVKVNAAFVRPNEVKTLIGSANRLKTVLPEWQTISLHETLAWMFKTSE